MLHTSYFVWCVALFVSIHNPTAPHRHRATKSTYSVYLLIFIHAELPLIRLVNPENPQIIALLYKATKKKKKNKKNKTPFDRYPFYTFAPLLIQTKLLIFSMEKVHLLKKKRSESRKSNCSHRYKDKVEGCSNAVMILFKYFRDWLALWVMRIERDIRATENMLYLCIVVGLVGAVIAIIIGHSFR